MKNIFSISFSPIFFGFCLFAISSNVSLALDAESLKSSLKSGFVPDKCAELIKECFSLKEDDAKGSCLYRSSKNMFCQGGPLGALAYKRSSILANSANDETLADPSRVDKDCVQNFDNQFSGELIKGQLGIVILDKLDKTLEACIQPPPIQLNRQ